MKSRAGWGPRVGSPLAVVIALGALVACGASEAAPSEGEAVPTRAAYYVSEYGIRVGTVVGFQEPREVTGARLVTGDDSDDASLYPMDGTDPDAPPTSVPLEPGGKVSVEGTLVVTCRDDAILVPIFEVESLREGAEQIDRFQPSDLAGWRKAVAEWCDRPLTMIVTGSSVTPAGRYEVWVQLSNPGPDSVTVTSAEVTDGPSSWDEATVEVPAGSITTLSIQGEGPPECGVTPPWELGLVTAGGRAITPTGSDGWC